MSVTLSKRQSVFLFALITLLSYNVSSQNKLSAEEIISKSLQSVGKVDATSQRRMAVGGSHFSIRSSSASASGRALLASDGTDMALFSTFNMRDYAMERIGIFSNKIDIPFVRHGQRSPLGRWLTAYDRTLDDRIFGGPIFSTWRFWGPQSDWGKIETRSKKKVGDREAWVVSYSPRRGLTSGSHIELYFDSENFQLLRTVYQQAETESGFYDTGNGGSNKGSAGRDWGADMARNGSKLTEDFGDYRLDNGLMLPHKYTITLTADVNSGTEEFRWDLNIEEFRLVKAFPPNFFSFNKDAMP